MFSWKGKDEFVESHRKAVTVHPNGKFEGGKVIYIEPEWSCFDLLNAASQRLDLPYCAKRVFNANGVDIDDCIMIEDDDILFLSAGDDFIAPEIESGSQYRIANGLESEKLPSIIGGYKVGKLLGRGAFGEVRVGQHQLTGERVALKFLRKSDILTIGAAERTITEIQCLTALKHQSIIRLQQHLESPQHVVLVFELMEGGDLKGYLHQRGSSAQDSVLSEEEARQLFHQIVSGVSFAHNQHICHRDLKLENILLKSASLSVVKIADFGLSAFYRPGATMKSSCGTLSFLAPEVFNGTANAGPPLDVWSLGVILFALLCGRLPFEGPDLNGTKRPRDTIIKSRIIKGLYKIDENLGPEAKDLVRRMLKLDPAERASIPEVLNHVWMRQSSHHDSSAIPPHLFGSLSVVPSPLSATSLLAVGTSKPERVTRRDSRHFSGSPTEMMDASLLSGVGDAERMREEVVTAAAVGESSDSVDDEKAVKEKKSGNNEDKRALSASTREKTDPTETLYGISGGRAKRTISSNSLTNGEDISCKCSAAPEGDRTSRTSSLGCSPGRSMELSSSYKTLAWMTEADKQGGSSLPTDTDVGSKGSTMSQPTFKLEPLRRSNFSFVDDDDDDDDSVVITPSVQRTSNILLGLDVPPSPSPSPSASSTSRPKSVHEGRPRREKSDKDKWLDASENNTNGEESPFSHSSSMGRRGRRGVDGLTPQNSGSSSSGLFKEDFSGSSRSGKEIGSIEALSRRYDLGERERMVESKDNIRRNIPSSSVSPVTTMLEKSDFIPPVTTPTSRRDRWSTKDYSSKLFGPAVAASSSMSSSSSIASPSPSPSASRSPSLGGISSLLGSPISTSSKSANTGGRNLQERPRFGT